MRHVNVVLQLTQSFYCLTRFQPSGEVVDVENGQEACYAQLLVRKRDQCQLEVVVEDLGSFSRVGSGEPSQSYYYKKPGITMQVTFFVDISC